MHVLVTGGAGFIGSHTCERLLARGDRVTALDAFDFGYDPALKERNAAELARYEGFRLVRGDVRDGALLERLLADSPPDVVVHLAARAGIRRSLEEPASYADINVTGTVRLLEAMRATGVDRLIFASSSSVYGARTAGPFRETDPVGEPLSPYAATKRAGELLCSTWSRLYGIEVTCLRFFTVYGPRQRPEMAIHRFTRRILRGEPIEVFGDGSSSRDYTFIDDIVGGVVAAVDRPLGYRVVNLGNSNPVRLSDLVRQLGRVLGREPIVRHLPDQLGDVPMTCADITLARELLGFRPATPIEEGLERFVAWLRDG